MSDALIESSFTWLDHRAEDAERAREVLKALDEGGTVDSLGVGTIRDAMADVLFPAISTLHTRARYLLFLPWIYRAIEEERIPSKRAAAIGRVRELQLTEALLTGSDDHEGVIGRVARGTLKQLPRIVYWNGMRVLGIRRFEGSIQQYFQSLDGHYRRTQSRQLANDDDPDAGGRVLQNWDPSLPEATDGFLEAATLHLTLEEAEYLRDRAQAKIPGTFLGQLLRAGVDIEADTWPWDYADLATDEVKAQLVHARWFSETIYGAQLLYNVLVARRIEAETGSDTQLEVLVELYQGWAQQADDERLARDQQWDREHFWSLLRAQNPRIPGAAEDFVRAWCARVDDGAHGILDDPEWATRIEQREVRLKRGLARLANARARETWNGTSGMTQLSFRWPETRAVVNDVVVGLAEGA